MACATMGLGFKGLGYLYFSRSSTPTSEYSDGVLFASKVLPRVLGSEYWDVRVLGLGVLGSRNQGSQE